MNKGPLRWAFAFVRFPLVGKLASTVVHFRYAYAHAIANPIRAHVALERSTVDD